MFSKISFILFFLFLSGIVHSQNVNTNNSVETIHNAGTKSELQSLALSYERIPNANTKKWAVTVKPTFSRVHGSEEVNQIKTSKLANKLVSYVAHQDIPTKAITPILGSNFEATYMQYGTPPDNSMAISNGGIIVSANNDKIEYYNEQGQLLYGDYWDDFLNDNTLTSSIFDPKVIYDSGADRFVLVVLHGSSPSSSKVVTCFSKTNNPQDGWWVYKLSGNPLNDNSWLDFPSIGVSNDELFITGNLFKTNGSFNQAFIYQMNKADGYNGNTINFQSWSNLSNFPFNAFTLSVASYGHQGNYGPGMYFVNNRSSGSDKVRLWHISNNIGGNPQISVSNISTSSYSVGADAAQQGTSDLLDVGDCRIQDAFLLGDYIHYVFSSDIGNGYSGINYNRLNYTNLTNVSKTIGLVNSHDYAYPSVASYSNSVNDKSVMIAFLRSSSNSFPEVRVVNCDDSFNFGSSVQVKAGETYVDVFAGNERWGDYVGIVRKHSNLSPTVWLCGSYGANLNFTYNHRYKAWIAEIRDPNALNAGFSANPVSGDAPLTVTYTDESTGNITSRLWSFSGGNPSSSSLQNPVVVYNNPGNFQTSLTVQNLSNNDNETKNNYINVSLSDGIEIVNNIENVKVFPNPVYDFYNILFEAKNKETITIKLINAQGKLVKLLFKAIPKQGENILHFNKNHLEIGTYFVIIESENKIIKNEKIIIN